MSSRQSVTPYPRPTSSRTSCVGDISWWAVGEECGEELFDLLVHKEKLLSMGRLYMTWCHGQPISLFNPDTFLESLTFRDLELILALQTLSLRYPPGTLTPQKRDKLDSMEKEARSAVMSRIASSEAELSTLQTLCILSMVEFAGDEK
ncbi:hypothetical protein E5D57_012336 [Metarhizium anisopliae]|nr:hypothetical protein E5D57_012336 [Metarhizium anisopliae]